MIQPVTSSWVSKDNYQGKEESEATTEKNDSEVATIIAAASKPKPRASRAKTSQKPTKRQKAKPKSQKLKNFRVVQRKKMK